MRTTHAGRARLAALATATALLVGGCTGGSDEPGAEDATDGTTSTAAPETESAGAASAARRYVGDLGRWSRRLSAVAERPVVRDGGFPKWPSLRPLLEGAPRLEPVEAPEGGTYERAAAAAERVDAVVAELRAFEPFHYGDDVRKQADKIYDAYYAYYQRLLRIDDRYYYRRLDVLGSDRPDVQIDRRVAAQYADYARDLVHSDRQYAADVRRVDAPGELRSSAVGLVLDEIDWLRRFHEEWRRECRAQEAAAYQVYKDLAFKARTSFDDVVAAAYDTRGDLTRSWARAVGRLGRLATGSGPLPAGAPLVGDAYREQVVARATAATKSAAASRRDQDHQLWMLWRLRELEDTPADAYADARSTLVLQAVADTRSPYEQLFETADQLRFVTTRASTEGVVRQLDQVLGAPVPPVLEEAWRAAGAEVQDFELRPGDVLDRITQARRLRQAVLRTLIPTADLLDSDRRMTNAIEDVLAAARPT